MMQGKALTVIRTYPLQYRHQIRPLHGFGNGPDI